MYKIVNGIEKIDKEDLVLVTEAGRTKGHEQRQGEVGGWWSVGRSDLRLKRWFFPLCCLSTSTFIPHLCSSSYETLVLHSTPSRTKH
ncbi:hypothetical protein E2C01_043460 [Portunus trituberculatus]|uniref:Uncharacterized protein n=1 Tax=Portunus trituberculatus TaxID=210409 RepID=A0A5B7FQD2_PORTR|nr:hypothetical protein [Portunus trituberculatus]